MNYYNEIKNIYNIPYIYNNEFSNYEDDFAFWIYWFKKIKPKKVIEIGIGNGRLIKLLSNTVQVYDALDFSNKIINDFKENNKWFKGKIYNQDMKKINIANNYDLIIVPFNTFNYLYTLNDLINFFNSIRKISTKKTIIIIDTTNPNILDLKNNNIFKLCNTFFINKIKCNLYEKHSYNNEKQIINYQKKYIFSNKKEITLNLPIRIFFHQELLNIIKLLNFDIIDILGDYNNEKYTQNSRKQILFIRKSDDKK